MSAEFVALVVVAALYLANSLGLLEAVGLKKKGSADAASELLIADRTNKRLADENRELRTAKIQLEQEALSPILTALHQNAELQGQVLDRLVHHNGSFKHMETALGEMAQGMKLLTGLIAGLHDLTVTPPERKTT